MLLKKGVINMANKIISTKKVKNICAKIKHDAVSISDSEKDAVDRAEIRGICLGINLFIEQLNATESKGQESA
jgi:hypothetical protein